MKNEVFRRFEKTARFLKSYLRVLCAFARHLIWRQVAKHAEKIRKNPSGFFSNAEKSCSSRKKSTLRKLAIKCIAKETWDITPSFGVSLDEMEGMDELLGFYKYYSLHFFQFFQHSNSS